MKLLMIVLNQVKKLDELLEGFISADIHGATIINSTGMVSELAKHIENYPIFGSLRFMVDLNRAESKTIFMVLKEEKVEQAKDIVRKTVGDLSKPNTAVIFTMPILSAEGIEI
ncbi:MAG: hypothetical protein GX148_02365 [Clostridiales bacterium]|nr:hypothetical protein [Clostridiales bacterium]